MLSIRGRRDGDRHTLLLGGELDLASAPQLEAQAQELCSQSASGLVLDLSELEFVDSAGLDAILRVRVLCQEHGCEFGLTPGNKPVQQLFEVTRLIDRLPFRKPQAEPEPPPSAEPSAAEADREPGSAP